MVKEVVDTKFQHNVDHLLQMTKQIAGNNSLKHFITDGLLDYMSLVREYLVKVLYTLDTFT